MTRMLTPSWKSLIRKAVAMTALLLLAFQFCPNDLAAANLERTGGGPIAPYDHEAYELAYSVFLANGKLDDAFRLALSAVSQRPGDIVWRRRLGEVAVWTDRLEVALDQWLFISDREQGVAPLDEAIRLARGVGKAEILSRLLKRRVRMDPPEQIWREYLQMMENSGEIDEAIAMLSSSASKTGDPFVLGQLARLSEQKGDLTTAMGYLDLAARNSPPTVERALEQARINYGRGDLSAAMKNLLSARNVAKPSDTVYWQTVGDLAWNLQDGDTAVLAGWILFSRNSARSDDLERIVIMLRDRDPDEAFAVSRTGWQRFGVSSFFLSMIDIGTAQGKWRELDDLYRNLSPAELARLDAIPYVWVCRIQVSEALGRKAETPTLYRQALARFPGNEELLAGYIWSLIDMRDLVGLASALQIHGGAPPETPLLRAALGAAYALLDRHDEALPYFEAEEKNRSADPLWMASYADLLERAGRGERALEIRKRAWELMAGGKEPESGGAQTRERLAAALRLAMKVEPGDTADRLASRFIELAEGDLDNELLLGWALGSGREELARIWTVRPPGGKPSKTPSWVLFTLALQANDREQLQDLLESKPADIPVRDRMEGYRRIGEYGKARAIAWQELGKDPADDELRRQYAEFVLREAGRVELLSSMQSRGDLSRFAMEGAVPFQLMPSLRIRPSVISVYQSVSGSNPAAVPSSDVSAELAVSVSTSAGDFELAGGGRSAVAGFPTFRIKGEHRIAPSFGLSVTFGYSQPAPESIPLLVGGAKDELTAEFSWGVTGRDNLGLVISGQMFHDQEGNRLGSGQRFSLGYSTRIEASNPGLELYTTLTGHHLSVDGSPGSKASRLVPVTRHPDAGYFVPKSFVQWEAGFFTDRSFLKGYSRRWKPYLGAGVAVNSVSGPGYSGEAGAAGPLFGQDRLSLAIRQGSDRFGGSGSSLGADIWYTYYLSP